MFSAVTELRPFQTLILVYLISAMYLIFTAHDAKPGRDCNLLNNDFQAFMFPFQNISLFLSYFDFGLIN